MFCDENNILEGLEYEVNCASTVFQSLKFDRVNILAIGSGACIRNLYFQGLEIDKLSCLSLLEVTKMNMTFGNHLSSVEERIKYLSKEGDLDIIILYVSCLDILAGTDYEAMIENLNKVLDTRVILFKRGPLNKRRMLPKDRYREIEEEILSYKEEKYG